MPVEPIFQVISQQYQSAQNVASNAVTIQIHAGDDTGRLIVIDNILITGQSSAATPAFTLEHNIGGSGAVIFWRYTGVAATAFNAQLVFPGGFPLWTAGGGSTPGGNTDIVLRGPANVSNASVLVTYHYLNPAYLR